MKVASITTFEPDPSQIQKFRENVAEAKKIHERLGGSVRVWQAGIAGAETGRVSYLIGHDSLEAFAQFHTKLSADADWAALQQKTVKDGTVAKRLGTALVRDFEV